MRRHASLNEDERTKVPLFVVCTKYDAWHSLVGTERFDPPIIKKKPGQICSLDLPEIVRVSEEIKSLIVRFSPELVGAVDSFADNVFFIPASATGRTPEKDEEAGIYGVRPSDIDPMWCDVPMLVSLAKWSGGLIPFRNIN